jgi:hypothetical protein
MFTKHTLTSLLISLVITSLASGKKPPNRAKANLVLGKVEFFSLDSPHRFYRDPPNAAELREPCSVTVDPVTRRVFVGDNGNNRILRYASADTLANGATPEAVSGQSDFTSRWAGAATRKTFSDNHRSIFIDTRG